MQYKAPSYISVLSRLRHHWQQLNWSSQEVSSPASQQGHHYRCTARHRSSQLLLSTVPHAACNFTLKMPKISWLSLQIKCVLSLNKQETQGDSLLWAARCSMTWWWKPGSAWSIPEQEVKSSMACWHPTGCFFFSFTAGVHQDTRMWRVMTWACLWATRSTAHKTHSYFSLLQA